jgi:hypothetical protein
MVLLLRMVKWTESAANFVGATQEKARQAQPVGIFLLTLRLKILSI